MKEALKLALDALEEYHYGEARIILRQALAQPDAFEQGRQEGMKQERALWELSKLGQEIEAKPKIGCVQHDCAECKARLAQPEQKWVYGILLLDAMSKDYVAPQWQRGDDK